MTVVTLETNFPQKRKEPFYFVKKSELSKITLSNQCNPNQYPINMSFGTENDSNGCLKVKIYRKIFKILKKNYGGRGEELVFRTADTE